MNTDALTPLRRDLVQHIRDIEDDETLVDRAQAIESIDDAVRLMDELGFDLSGACMMICEAYDLPLKDGDVFRMLD